MEEKKYVIKKWCFKIIITIICIFLLVNTAFNPCPHISAIFLYRTPHAFFFFVAFSIALTTASLLRAPLKLIECSLAYSRNAAMLQSFR